MKLGFMIACLSLFIAATPAHTTDTPDVILSYAKSRTFVDYPPMRLGQFGVKDGEAALAKAHAEAEPVDQLRNRPDVEHIAGMYAEIGGGYSAMGEHQQSLAMYEKARALTHMPGMYDSDVADEVAWVGDADEAKRLYEDMLAKRPADYYGRREYGRFLIQRGLYAAARDELLDLLKAPDLDDDTRAYALVFLYLAAKGAGDDASKTLRPYALDVVGSDWPLPLVSYFAGLESEAQLLKDLRQGEDPDGNLCEALFYLGRDTELSGHTQAAVAFYRQVIRTDYVGFGEYGNASKRLQALSAHESSAAGSR